MDAYKKIMAGLLIGLGGYANMKLGGVVGAALFSLGLLSVIHFRLPLFTGRVSNLDEYKKPLNLLDMLWGNTCGAAAIGILVTCLCSGLDTGFVTAKLTKSVPQVFFDAIICGLCVSIAAKAKRQLITVLAVMLFVLCGGEHCIADFFYFSALPQLKGAECLAALGVFLVAVIGNTIGGLVVSKVDSV